MDNKELQTCSCKKISRTKLFFATKNNPYFCKQCDRYIWSCLIRFERLLKWFYATGQRALKRRKAMVNVVVSCRACGSELLYKHGRSRSGEPRYRWRECHGCFQLNYRNEANKVGVSEKIVDMALNGSGIRDTARVLGVSTNTVLAHLKNSIHQG